SLVVIFRGTAQLERALHRSVHPLRIVVSPWPLTCTVGGMAVSARSRINSEANLISSGDISSPRYVDWLTVQYTHRRLHRVVISRRISRIFAEFSKSGEMPVTMPVDS